MNKQKKPHLFISAQIPVIESSLKNKCTIEIWKDEERPTKQELIQKTKKADALICMLSDLIDKDFLDQCPYLKVISTYSVGLNHIDLEEAKKRGIKVGYTPNVLTEATAELSLALLLGLSRNISKSYNNVRGNKWKKWEPMGYLGPALNKKTLGIIGMGEIGSSFAEKCYKAFNMKIIYHSRSSKKEIDKKLNAKKVSLEEILKESDIVSLHCPLTSETKSLMTENRFYQMKKNAIFLNTARGELHDEEALYNVLSSGHLYGAALDVTNPEPISPNSPLLLLDNIIITPHIGSATNEARDEMAKLCFSNILAGLENKILPKDALISFSFLKK